MKQGSLFDVDPIAAVPGLTCPLNEPWIGAHPLCAAQLERDCAEFDRLVAAGVYDADGYRPNERKAMQRKAARHG